MQKHKENYVQVSADRAVMPDYKWVFNFHAEFVTKAFGKINSPEAFEKATQRVKEYNEKNGGTFCVIEQMDNDTIVADDQEILECFSQATFHLVNPFPTASPVK